jgi:hypothetical protein
MLILLFTLLVWLLCARIVWIIGRARIRARAGITYSARREQLIALLLCSALGPVAILTMIYTALFERKVRAKWA